MCLPSCGIPTYCFSQLGKGQTNLPAAFFSFTAFAMGVFRHYVTTGDFIAESEYE